MNFDKDTTVSSSNHMKRMKISKLRLFVMRALFFLNFISLAFDNWSSIFFPQQQWDILSGVAISFWAGFSFLNLLGIRFPLKMLPILLLQLLYKSGWLIGTYLPARKHNLLNASFEEFFWICVGGIVLNILIIPWRYVYQQYIRGFFRISK